LERTAVFSDKAKDVPGIPIEHKTPVNGETEHSRLPGDILNPQAQGNEPAK
jgi:hypothetical protein